MENNNIRAVLKPNGYRAQREFFLKEKLYGYDYSPIVAYGTDKGSHIEYQEATDPDDLKQKLSDIKKEALENISKIQVTHTVQKVENDLLFLVDPHEYAAEKILDKAFLATVAKELGNESFLVGIPHQGVFAAVSSSSSFKNKFMGFIKQKFENPEANTITPHVFEIFQGEIIGVGGEDLGGNMNTIEQKQNGDLIVQLESTNIQEFADQVSNGYTQALLLAMKSSGFSGNIIFNENNEDFHFDNAVLVRCRSFNKKIVENDMAQTMSKAISGNEIVPSFTQAGKLVDLSEDGTVSLNESRSDGEGKTESKTKSESKGESKSESKSKVAPIKKKWWQFWK